MKPEVWGPAIWTLFHTLIEKINEDEYKIIGIELYNFISQICNFLPCPECAKHASRFLSSVKLESVKTKEGLRKIIYILHNAVNLQKQKKLYNYDDLEIYKTKNIIVVYNNFIKCFKSSTGNMKLINDGFQRQMIAKNFRKWFLKNFKSFII
jgi:uncharacterized protein YvpB